MNIGLSNLTSNRKRKSSACGEAIGKKSRSEFETQNTFVAQNTVEMAGPNLQANEFSTLLNEIRGVTTRLDSQQRQISSIIVQNSIPGSENVIVNDVFDDDDDEEDEPPVILSEHVNTRRGSGPRRNDNIYAGGHAGGHRQPQAQNSRPNLTDNRQFGARPKHNNGGQFRGPARSFSGDNRQAPYQAGGGRPTSEVVHWKHDQTRTPENYKTGS